MSHPFSRSQITWLMYLMLSFFGYLLNILGPITPFLMEEFRLSYTISSLHFTAFAFGLVLVGLGGHFVVERIGRRKALWMSAFSMSLGIFIFTMGKTPALTILACFLMGTTGSFIPVLVSSVLSDHYGAQRTIALSEANFFASSSAAIGPLLVGWFSRMTVIPLAGWRFALLIAAIIPLGLWWFNRNAVIPERPEIPGETGREKTIKSGTLPARYSVWWAAIVLSVSIEFCMIFWSADYLEKIHKFGKADAALFVSLLLGGMILGRLLGSRLIQRVSEIKGIIISLVILLIGFLLFWLVGIPFVSTTGLFLTGLGIANLYPYILSLALGSAGNQAVQASARASLASGVAILCLPLILGRLADMLGIRMAYGVILLLLAGLFMILMFMRRQISTQKMES
jgi:fucose permease